MKTTFTSLALACALLSGCTDERPVDSDTGDTGDMSTEDTGEESTEDTGAAEPACDDFPVGEDDLSLSNEDSCIRVWRIKHTDENGTVSYDVLSGVYSFEGGPLVDLAEGTYSVSEAFEGVHSWDGVTLAHRYNESSTLTVGAESVEVW